jgi:spermidine synthase
MAVLFSQIANGKTVEVRSAGSTRRLYVDGVLHTQFNPRAPLTGDVWDPLCLSALFAPKGQIRRVLLLGLGGGAAVHLLRRYLNVEEIVAVELDGLKIKLARRFFEIDAPNVTLIRADARGWVEDYDGPPFDFVIDDLFGEEDGEPQRAIPVDRRWAAALCRLLAKRGLLTVNFVGRAELEASDLFRNQRYRRRFASAHRYALPQAENAVTLFSNTTLSRRSYRRLLRCQPGLTTVRARSLMRFRIHREW